MAFGNIVKVLSTNCQGLQNYKQRKDVLDYLDNLSPSIICLQDTHWLDTDMQTVKQIWNRDCFLSCKSSNSRGVAILLKRNETLNIRYYQVIVTNQVITLWLTLKYVRVTLN